MNMFFLGVFGKQIRAYPFTLPVARVLRYLEHRVREQILLTSLRSIFKDVDVGVSQITIDVFECSEGR